MRRLIVMSMFAGLLGAPVAHADNREELVRAYVDRIVVNSLDEPDRHELYFSEIQLLNDFSEPFVNAYSEALKAAKARGDVSLFEVDAMTGDINRCPIGDVAVVDRTRADTRNMIEVTLATPSCGTGASAGDHHLMFVLEPLDASGRKFAIDDILRPLENGGWFSLQAWMERRAARN